MDYIEVTCRFPISQENTDRVISVMSDNGFDGFVEEEEHLLAYIPARNFEPGLLTSLKFPFDPPLQLTFSVRHVSKQNWNQLWESSYEPVRVGDTCLIRAPFHPPLDGIAYDIVIEPRMSFGTAHHDTTRLMIEALLKLDVKGKSVLDMGCGTGLLAILADKMGAERVTAIDNDEWAYSNALENTIKNNTVSCSVYHTDATAIGNDRYDLILANINRNTLVEDMPLYAKGLRKSGILIVSGFYVRDIELIHSVAKDNGMEMIHNQLKGDWAAVRFVKMEPVN
jgi:ribosomal protein L11 methyltransferase